MNVQINESWNAHLKDEFKKPYFKKLTDFVKQQYLSKTVYPQPKEIFKAFDLCPFDKVKVVILGQDPYHGPRQANGLCFSVHDKIKVPPSLQNIFKEIQSNTGQTLASNPPKASKSGDLEYLAKQGILLLNATLTVQASKAGSHQNKGWETFTDCAIKTLSGKRENIVFMLWGAYAQKKGTIIDTSKHLVLKAPHPSPLSAHRGFFGCKHFSKANEYLKQHDLKEINWISN